MKISVSESSLWNFYFPEQEYYRHIHDCGFDYVDYNFYNKLGDDSSRYLGEGGLDAAREMRDYLGSIGVQTLMAHAPKGEPALDTDGIARRTIRAIECCKIMGIPNLVYHPCGFPGWTRREYIQKNVEYVQRLLPTLEKCGVCLLLENIGRWDEPYFDHNASEMLDLIHAVNHPLYHVCLDTGHLSLQDGNPYEAIVALGDHLRALHIQDNYGSLPVPTLNKPWRQDLHLPPLMGAVNFDEIMLGLRKIGYRGLFNMELESPRAYGKENRYAPNPKLRIVPLELCMEYYRWVHDIAEYILHTYNMDEE